MPTFRRALAFVLLATGCSHTSFERASELDTVQAYQEFLREHPEDPEATTAQGRIEGLEFDEAKRLHSVIAYKRFLETYPDAPQRQRAQTLLEGLRFNVAKEADSEAGWRQFLAEHPDGAHRDEARAKLQAAQERELQTTTDPQRVSRLLQGEAAGARREELERKLDDTSFAQATDAGKLFAYLRDFPAGAHREEVRVKLLELEVEGLLVSGLVDEAEAKVKTHPLGPKLTGFPARLARARAEQGALARTEPAARAMQAGHYLRDLEDLKRALVAPDPLDRWQAAEELGQHVSVRAVDPLLEALRTARNPLIRQNALSSLRSVLSALPAPVAAYEVASRLESLRERASSPELYITVAALLDLSGQVEQAASQYQRVYESGGTDPLVLWRWVQLREQRQQAFSSAVAARQLAVWAQTTAREENVSAEGGVPLASARQLCAAVVDARFAAQAIARVRGQKTEFPEDLADFERTAQDAIRLAEAKLADAELLLRQQHPGVRTCADQQVAERLSQGVKERTQALQQASSAKLPKPVGTLLLELARERDPSPEVRAAAASRLAGSTPP
ncbi:HEAT repeat domain-containing protein [Corallococcus sp. AB049A]|uniref:HEAT repeat domain-containing protein n=1 Tax=Corallococcus interemptor TaxID=2316720 RepID=A0A3A8QZR3_9BACT|nr:MULTISPECIES: HEAT repeat domain-containing protein [Corallococcus]RKH41201.1 HEAT repeat domain-containing protein [Corallococcus sp. AB050B]RKH73271.1 HEAT repeat domain-containing protein [Corallococcus interemptor]RKI42247.1 HEAT repeat domain-containing protein [Corallococcus sp. AB049A]